MTRDVMLRYMCNGVKYGFTSDKGPMVYFVSLKDGQVLKSTDRRQSYDIYLEAAKGNKECLRSELIEKKEDAGEREIYNDSCNWFGKMNMMGEE